MYDKDEKSTRHTPGLHKTGLYLIEVDEKEITERKHREEDDDIEYNIQQISKTRDLSPRHISSIKNSAKG